MTWASLQKANANLLTGAVEPSDSTLSLIWDINAVAKKDPVNRINSFQATVSYILVGSLSGDPLLLELRQFAVYAQEGNYFPN